MANYKEEEAIAELCLPMCVSAGGREEIKETWFSLSNCPQSEMSTELSPAHQVYLLLLRGRGTGERENERMERRGRNNTPKLFLPEIGG